MWCQTPNEGPLLPVVLLAIGEEFRSPSRTLLVLARLAGFLILASFFTPTFNKRLALPPAGIVSAIISSKTGFAEWHASKGGWVCYANDFPDAWPRCNFIVSAFSGVPIKRGAIKAIGAATPMGKGKEKEIKQEAVKNAEIEENVKGTEVGPKTKKRKITTSRKQLVIFEELEGVDPSTVGKKVGHP